MRIVIEIDGEKVTSVGTEASLTEGPLPTGGDSLPGPAPADLLKRAKALGAMSAGAAQFGIGTALASASQAGKPLRPLDAKPPKASKKRVGGRAKR